LIALFLAQPTPESGAVLSGLAEEHPWLREAAREIERTSWKKAGWSYTARWASNSNRCLQALDL
jgi:hypothetical protein